MLGLGTETENGKESRKNASFGKSSAIVSSTGRQSDNPNISRKKEFLPNATGRVIFGGMNGAGVVLGERVAVSKLSSTTSVDSLNADYLTVARDIMSGQEWRRLS